MKILHTIDVRLVSQCEECQKKKKTIEFHQKEPFSIVYNCTFSIFLHPSFTCFLCVCSFSECIRTFSSIRLIAIKQTIELNRYVPWFCRRQFQNRKKTSNSYPPYQRRQSATTNHAIITAIATYRLSIFAPFIADTTNSNNNENAIAFMWYHRRILHLHTKEMRVARILLH